MRLTIALVGVLVLISGAFWLVSHETMPPQTHSLEGLIEEQQKVEKELVTLSEEHASTTSQTEVSGAIPNEPDIKANSVSHGTENIKNSVKEREKLENQLVDLQNQIDFLLAPKYDPYPYIDFVNPTGFVNSKPFKLADFIGEKVVLLKFTTYSCINCQNTYPYVLDWYEKYQDKGLEIVFIHTPEFAFEHKIENVEQAMLEEGVSFSVVLDNNYETWRAYGNRYWPRMYLIDIHGNIVYDHRGEGAYAVTEAKINQLLAERTEVLAGR